MSTMLHNHFTAALPMLVGSRLCCSEKEEALLKASYMFPVPQSESQLLTPFNLNK